MLYVEVHCTAYSIMEEESRLYAIVSQSMAGYIHDIIYNRVYVAMATVGMRYTSL